MRCPKCGYISFDHLEKCLNCNKNIEAISESLFGSTYNIQAPTFLKLHGEQREDSSERPDFAEDQSFGDDDEYVDDELAILIEEDDSDELAQINLADDEQPALSFSDDDEEEDREIEIDFSQFEDAGEPEVNLADENELEDELQLEQENDTQFSMKIDMPEELSDISDLAPPAKNIGKNIEKEEPPAGNPASSDFSDLNLDDLDFDLGLDDLDSEKPSRPEVPDEAILALDEIDFSETLAGSGKDTSKKPGSMDLDMDLDLDFDLDLGGLSIHKDV